MKNEVYFKLEDTPDTVNTKVRGAMHELCTMIVHAMLAEPVICDIIYKSVELYKLNAEN